MSDRGRRTRLQLPEERPLLQRNRPSHASQFQVPLYGCMTNPHNHLPVYTNIHRIRRDIISIVEDYLSLEQLRDVRINIAVVRPLVDKLYELDDISIGESSSMSPRAIFTCLSGGEKHTLAVVVFLP